MEPISTKDEIHGINVTPLVDVSLVLVLIFMVTSPFFVKPLKAVRLPPAQTAEVAAHENIAVSIGEDGTWAINENPVAPDHFREELEKAMKETGFDFVLIRADEAVPHADVLEILRTANTLKAKRVAFATTPKV
jgi:biopolymer transport protein ExbD